MRRFVLVRLATVGLIVAALFVSGAAGGGPAFAQQEGKSGGAVVYSGFQCGILVPGTGDQDSTRVLTTNDTHAVVTPSGNATVVCRSEIETTDGSETVQYNDLACTTFTPGGTGPGTSSRTIVTASGQVILVCHLHANQQPES